MMDVSGREGKSALHLITHFGWLGTNVCFKPSNLGTQTVSHSCRFSNVFSFPSKQPDRDPAGATASAVTLLEQKALPPDSPMLWIQMLPQDGAAMVYSECVHWHRALAEKSNLVSSRRGCSLRLESAKRRIFSDHVNAINKLTWNSLPMNLGSGHDSALIESWPEQTGVWQFTPGHAVSELVPPESPSSRLSPSPSRWDSQLVPWLCPSSESCSQGRDQPTLKGDLAPE